MQGMPSQSGLVYRQVVRSRAAGLALLLLALLLSGGLVAPHPAQAGAPAATQAAPGLDALLPAPALKLQRESAAQQVQADAYIATDLAFPGRATLPRFHHGPSLCKLPGLTAGATERPGDFSVQSAAAPGGLQAHVPVCVSFATPPLYCTLHSYRI